MTNYVLHHGVTNVNKPGKVRVAFDAAAQFGKTCLNEKLLQGLHYLNKLNGIVLRICQESYAAISDIEQMYHQIKVAENNQDVLRFIWRDNTDRQIVVHIIKVHIFGKIGSPCIANWVIKRTASGQLSQYVNKVIETKQFFYMNSYLDCLAFLERQQKPFIK